MAKNLQLKGWCINEQALDLELDLAEQSDRLDDVKRLEEFLLDVRNAFYLKSYCFLFRQI